MDGRQAPWRDTMRPVRFYFMDARLLVLLTVWLFVPAWWTTAAVVLAVAALRVPDVPYALVSRDGRETRLAFRREGNVPAFPELENGEER